VLYDHGSCSTYIGAVTQICLVRIKEFVARSPYNFGKFDLLIEFSKINSILKISCGNFPKYNLKNPKYNLEKIQFDKLEIIRKKGTGHFDEKCRWLGRKLGLFASDAFPTLVGGQH